jgi:uncharacterized membrane protein
MAELVCVAFDHIGTADDALNELQTLHRENVVEIADACVVIRRSEGGLRLKQTVNLMTGGVVGGAILGSLWGWIVGWLFLDPLAGMLVGAGAGAATGAITAALSDYGIDDDFIRRLGSRIRPGGSALFVLLHRANADDIPARLGRWHGSLLHTSLNEKQERRLRAMLAKATVA